MNPSQRAASSEVRLRGRRRFKEKSTISDDKELKRNDDLSRTMKKESKITPSYHIQEVLRKPEDIKDEISIAELREIPSEYLASQNKESKMYNMATMKNKYLVQTEEHRKYSREDSKRKEKLENDTLDRKVANEYVFPFGKPGAGAPLRTPDGAIVTDLRRVRTPLVTAPNNSSRSSKLLFDNFNDSKVIQSASDDVDSKRITTSSRRRVVTASQENYLLLLENQIQEQKERKKWEKEQQEIWDRKKAIEISLYNPWGRPGAGAPMRDQNGHPIGDLKKSLQSSITRNERTSDHSLSFKKNQVDESSIQQKNVGIKSNDGTNKDTLSDKEIFKTNEYEDDEGEFIRNELDRITKLIIEYRWNTKDINQLRRDLSSCSMLLRMYEKTNSTNDVDHWITEKK